MSTIHNTAKAAEEAPPRAEIIGQSLFIPTNGPYPEGLRDYTISCMKINLGQTFFAIARDREVQLAWRVIERPSVGAILVQERAAPEMIEVAMRHASPEDLQEKVEITIEAAVYLCDPKDATVGEMVSRHAIERRPGFEIVEITVDPTPKRRIGPPPERPCAVERRSFRYIEHSDWPQASGWERVA